MTGLELTSSTHAFDELFDVVVCCLYGAYAFTTYSSW